MIRVWDPLVRGLHGLLVAGVVLAWGSGHWDRWFTQVHHMAGYAAAAAVAMRVVWGLTGGRYARFGQFVRSPRATWAYARQLRAGTEPRYIGHNPLGGWMVLALLAAVAAASLTGFLYTTDWLWGYEWLSELHAVLAWLLLVLVLSHLSGVLFTSWRQRENLVRAMITGNKPAAGDGDVA